MGYLAFMQVEVVGCGIVGFKHREVLAVEMRVPRLARMYREEERDVRIVRIEKE